MNKNMKKILVIGASGFVGGNLAKQLLSEGYAVRCLVRTPSKVQDLAELGCEIVQGDISDLESIQNAVKSVDAVYISIHTMSVQPANKEAKSFMDIELDGLRNIVTACQANKVNRVIFVTFLGAASDAPQDWAKDRWKSEQFLLNSGLDVTILRPGMIVGIGGQGYNMVLGNGKKRFAIIMGNGENRFQSIAVLDLVYYLVGVMDDALTYGQCYDVGDSEIISMNGMVNQVAEVLGRKHPTKFHVPLALLSAFASPIESMAKMPAGAMKGIVDGMKSDLVGDTAPITKLLKRPLLTFKEATQKALK
jgi:uncharacterized protein YbjT (DUF2867 family)